MAKKNKTGLGRSLIKDRFSKRRPLKNDSMLHTAELDDGYDWNRINLKSVTEESSFQEFLSTATLAGTEFQAEKLNVAFVNPKTSGLLTDAQKAKFAEDKENTKDILKIPRRPKWDENTSAEELKQNENSSFLSWRRQLAILQDEQGLILTPYEKNLDFWRQLWRVIERSDVIIQILDARNPLIFRSEDLEQYVKEVDQKKKNMLLVNKSDFLTLSQRKSWATYFKSIGIKAVFFSAILPEDISNESESDEFYSADESFDEALQNLDIDKKKPWDLLSITELVNLFESVLDDNEPRVTNGVTTIGLVGYPNVGKSSTINALMQSKKVSVSATPGKTKHFQTLFLTEKVLLCDCPGLVFPSLVSTKAEMVLNGILPIDQLKDHVPSITLLCSLIPRQVLESKYSIMIPKPIPGEDPERAPTSEEFLNAYAYIRGFMTQNGQPDNPRVARLVLKDFVQGQLLYCTAPPGVKQEDFHKFKNLKVPPKPTQQAIRAGRLTVVSSEDVDHSFFNAKSTGVHSLGNEKTANKDLQNQSKKPWKDHKEKRNKKEKLRRVYRHLDE